MTSTTPNSNGTLVRRPVFWVALASAVCTAVIGFGVINIQVVNHVFLTEVLEALDTIEEADERLGQRCLGGPSPLVDLEPLDEDRIRIAECFRTHGEPEAAVALEVVYEWGDDLE